MITFEKNNLVNMQMCVLILKNVPLFSKEKSPKCKLFYDRTINDINLMWLRFKWVYLKTIENVANFLFFVHTISKQCSLSFDSHYLLLIFRAKICLYFWCSLTRREALFWWYSIWWISLLFFYSIYVYKAILSNTIKNFYASYRPVNTYYQN